MAVVFGRTRDYKSGELGNAILSNLPVLRTRNEPLPSTPSTPEKTHYPRGAVAARVRSEEGAAFWFVSTHFQHNLREDRIAEAKTIHSLFAGEEAPPTILAGDLNARPESRPMEILLHRWADAGRKSPSPTVPSKAPARRIDYVLYRPSAAWRVVESRVLEAPLASDHRPVLAVLERE